MNTIIESLLEYELTVYVIHRAMRVIDQHIYTKKWLPQITIKKWNDTYEDVILETYVGGKLNGPFKSWNNDELREECEHLNGKYHGTYRWWKYRQLDGKYEYRSRQLGEECEYLNGKRVCKKWWFNGQLTHYCEYKNGWYENGYPLYECKYLNGKQLENDIYVEGKRLK